MPATLWDAQKILVPSPTHASPRSCLLPFTRCFVTVIAAGTSLAAW